MPSKTFLGLPAEKQVKIIAAAREAFSQAPYSEVTITDIIKLAEIPRGSFYQYFKDKEDIYFYLLETFRQDFKDILSNNLQEQQGDLFAAFSITFHEMLKFLSTTIDRRLLQNIFMEMDYRGYQHLLKREFHHPHHQGHEPGHLSEWQQSIKDQTDFSKLRVSQDEFDLMLHMLLGFMGQSVARYFMAQRDPERKMTPELYEHKFDLLLDWFEHGVLKENAGRELNA
ncbi:TetR/AcrR family transcriptional regulator [Lapidilactobacillus bayanensis]|uniref:TetR/AcrR family transcriptional regulator n=1 Tax=Lapidilactobacillus bayanensis TaxID=2485998 RepID=UPI000F78D718|nr:TetR/AcrR family transcriptional regulator [Lapidilactobacillus bayanensis]